MNANFRKSLVFIQWVAIVVPGLIGVVFLFFLYSPRLFPAQAYHWLPKNFYELSIDGTYGLQQGDSKAVGTGYLGGRKSDIIFYSINVTSGPPVTLRGWNGILGDTKAFEERNIMQKSDTFQRGDFKVFSIHNDAESDSQTTSVQIKVVVYYQIDA